MPVDPRMRYRVSRLYQSRGKGCSGNVIGVDGTLNWPSSARMAVALRVEGRNAIDFGCGNGRFMAMALAMGAYGLLWSLWHRASSKRCAAIDILRSA
jgi:hypothetical protein